LIKARDSNSKTLDVGITRLFFCN